MANPTFSGTTHQRSSVLCKGGAVWVTFEEDAVAVVCLCPGYSAPLLVCWRGSHKIKAHKESSPSIAQLGTIKYLRALVPSAMPTSSLPAQPVQCESRVAAVFRDMDVFINQLIECAIYCDRNSCLDRDFELLFFY